MDQRRLYLTHLRRLPTKIHRLPVVHRPRLLIPRPLQRRGPPTQEVLLGGRGGGAELGARVIPIVRCVGLLEIPVLLKSSSLVCLVIGAFIPFASEGVVVLLFPRHKRSLNMKFRLIAPIAIYFLVVVGEILGGTTGFSHECYFFVRVL